MGADDALLKDVRVRSFKKIANKGYELWAWWNDINYMSVLVVRFKNEAIALTSKK